MRRALAHAAIVLALTTPAGCGGEPSETDLLCAFGDQAPAWTPNGQTIVFSRCSPEGTAGSARLYSVPARGGSPKLVGRDFVDPDAAALGWGFDDNPAFAPDGRIAVQTGGFATRIWIVDDGRASQLPAWELEERDPAWSHNGALAFGRDGRLVVLRGTRANDLGSAHPYQPGPSWAPDGRWLVYVTRRGDLAVVGASGRGRRLLVRNGGEPTWSPDGLMIVFVREFQLFLIPARGGEAHRLLKRSFHASAPAHSPDGTLLAFSHDPLPEGDAAGVYLVRSDGSGLRRLTSGGR